jgi:hypothetical protein
MTNEQTTNLPQAFREMQTDMTVTMDDVVSAFVSKYEANLFERKKVLSVDIKTLEADLEALTKEVTTSTDTDKYAKDLPFGLVSEVLNVKLNWSDSKIIFEISIQSKEHKNGYRPTIITVQEKATLAKKYVTHYDQINKALVANRAELATVLDSIKTLTRKEREVRGRLAMRKLEDSGYADMMQDEELLQLVQL